MKEGSVHRWITIGRQSHFLPLLNSFPTTAKQPKILIAREKAQKPYPSSKFSPRSKQCSWWILDDFRRKKPWLWEMTMSQHLPLKQMWPGLQSIGILMGSGLTRFRQQKSDRKLQVCHPQRTAVAPLLPSDLRHNLPIALSDHKTKTAKGSRPSLDHFKPFKTRLPCD
jgi:hypothetical protein